jgi:hypothetical protein
MRWWITFSPVRHRCLHPSNNRKRLPLVPMRDAQRIGAMVSGERLFFCPLSVKFKEAEPSAPTRRSVRPGAFHPYPSVPAVF